MGTSAPIEREIYVPIEQPTPVEQPQIETPTPEKIPVEVE